VSCKKASTPLQHGIGAFIHEMIYCCGFADWSAKIFGNYLCQEQWPDALSCCILEKIL